MYSLARINPNTRCHVMSVRYSATLHTAQMAVNPLFCTVLRMIRSKMSLVDSNARGERDRRR
jgi:hypothetical protein